jgi:hypothetical protein
MLQKLRPHIAECLERAAECRRRLLEAEDPARREELLDFEKTWMHLARSYEFVESLERFLLDANEHRVLRPGSIAMTELATIHAETPDTMECRACGETMRLYGIEAHPAIARTVLKTYICPDCDSVQTRAAPAFAGKRRGAGRARDNAFDAETTHLLGAAFDAAWDAMLSSGNPPLEVRQATAVRESLAKHLIEMVRRGERNPQRLVEDAVLLAQRSPAAKIELPAG